MARTSGSNNFAGTLEILASSALDARDIVQTKADLTASGSFPYPYVGMETYVIAENKKYRLIADDPTVIDNWEEVGGGGSIDVELTQDEYDALPASKETDGINYFVKDGVPASQRIVETGFTPVGTIISIMGTTAPQHYLACDGTVVNVADYPVLAAYFEEQFGSSNFFGGDGETTFAVPDLRGEFLRGTGTNSHANQGSGASVGVHQDGTEHVGLYGWSGNKIGVNTENVTSDIENVRDRYNDYGTGRKGIIVADGSPVEVSSSVDYSTFTSRPTNTSVLYCIATKNIYVDARFDYSLVEKVVGTWIDGSAIYQKTVSCGALTDASSANASKTVNHSIANISKIVNIYGVAINSNGYTNTIPYAYVSNDNIATRINMVAGPATVEIYYRGNLSNVTETYVTLQYTKTT